MTVEQAAKQILALFSKHKLKFGEAMTTDGALLKWEGELEIGTMLMLVTEEGTEIEVPSGSYQIEDGRTLIVEASVVVDIQNEEMPEEVIPVSEESLKKMQSDEAVEIGEAAAEGVAQEVESTLPELSPEEVEQIQEIVAESIAELVEEVAELRKQLSTMRIAHRKTIEVITEMSKIPTAEPTVKPNNPLFSKEEKLAKFLKNMEQLKKNK